MADQKLLCTMTDSFMVNVITTKLENAGIESWIMNKQDSSYLTFGDIKIYVLEDDYINAKSLLDIEGQ